MRAQNPIAANCQPFDSCPSGRECHRRTGMSALQARPV